MTKLDDAVAAAKAAIEGTGLSVAVVAWKPGLATGVQSIALGSDDPDEARAALTLAVLVCAQATDLSRDGHTEGDADGRR